MVQATGAPIAQYFAALDDPRIDRTKRHKLLDINTVTIHLVKKGLHRLVPVRGDVTVGVYYYQSVEPRLTIKRFSMQLGG